MPGTKRRALVAQSGGPSPVINASLLGVFDGCKGYPEHIGEVLAARHGVEGILKEDLISLDAEPEQERELLALTPAAGAIGTCRYKLDANQEEDFTRIVDVCAAHDVGYFFYIGGNDSMDTAAKVSGRAVERGVDLVCTGVPKTIDNDVGDIELDLVDHTPGYGSAARYWAMITQIVEEENRGMYPSEPVAVLQAMGRTAGFIPAAARLADPYRETPLQLYLTESHHTLESLHHHVNETLARRRRCVVVLSEGFDVGGVGEARDGFGHVEYGASRSTVAQIVVNYLNDRGLAVPGNATFSIPGVLQRATSIFASTVDQEEARGVGRHAVAVALSHGSGYMATIRRRGGGLRAGAKADGSEAVYQPFFEHVPLEQVAASARHLPKEWLSKDQTDVTDDFVAYAGPLIGNRWPEMAIEEAGAGPGVPAGYPGPRLQRFARLEAAPIAKKLPDYVPVRHR